MKRILSRIFCIIVLITLLISPVRALKGTDAWEVDGYIAYEVDLSQNWNYDYYTNEDPYINYDIEGVTMTDTYTGMDEDLMVFERSTSSKALEAWWESFDLDDTTNIDPDTGLDEDGGWYGVFLDTSDFADGYEVSGTDFLVEYEDDSGVHSTSKKRIVSGDKTTIEAEVNGKTRKIDVWDTIFRDFNINYTSDNVEYQMNFKDIVDRVSDMNGVCMGATFIQVAKFKELDGEYVTLLTISYESRAIKISGVYVSRNGSAIPGFELGIVAILLILGFFYRKRYL